MGNITNISSSINTERPADSAEKKQWTSPKMDTWSLNFIENIVGNANDGGALTYNG